MKALFRTDNGWTGAWRVAGLLTRFTAASIALIMLGAITLVQLPHGFFMNWFGIAAALLIEGGGRWSADRGVAESIAQ